MIDIIPGALVTLHLRDDRYVLAKILHPRNPFTADYTCITIYDHFVAAEPQKLADDPHRHGRISVDLDTVEAPVIIRLAVMARQILEDSYPARVGEQPVSEEEYAVIGEWIRYHSNEYLTEGLLEDPDIDFGLEKPGENDADDEEPVEEDEWEEEPEQEPRSPNEEPPDDIDHDPADWNEIVFYRSPEGADPDVDSSEWARNAPFIMQEPVDSPLVETLRPHKNPFLWSHLLRNSALYDAVFCSSADREHVLALIASVVDGDPEAAAELTGYDDAIDPISRTLQFTKSVDVADALLEVLVAIGTEPAYEVIVGYLDRHPDPHRNGFSFAAARAYCGAVSRDLTGSAALRRYFPLLKEIRHPELLEDRDLALETIAQDAA